jgi:hypothetical protein
MVRLRVIGLFTVNQTTFALTNHSLVPDIEGCEAISAKNRAPIEPSPRHDSAVTPCMNAMADLRQWHRLRIRFCDTSVIDRQYDRV